MGSLTSKTHSYAAEIAGRAMLGEMLTVTLSKPKNVSNQLLQEVNWMLWLEQCRQAKLTYVGKFQVDMNLQYNDGVPLREKIDLGQFPVMLKVSDVMCYSLCLSFRTFPL